MKTAYSYRRWSTVSQSDNDSQTRQSDSANRWIKDFGKSQGYVLSEQTFTDAGKSGFKGKHIEKDEFGLAKGDLGRFIQCVEKGQIKSNSILLIDDFSRFSRLEPVKSLNLFLTVINSGVGLVFTGSYEKRIINSELINKEGHVLQFIIGEMIRSHAESAERGRKVKAAKQSLFTNIKNGICQRNNLPKYFTFVPNPGEKSIGKYVHNERTHIIKDIVKMIIEGKSLYSISRSLNQQKIKTFKNSQWSGAGLKKIIRNRLLIGEYKGIKNYVPKIVEEDEFLKVQNILSQNTNNKGKQGDVINIFRGICFCSRCGAPMSVMSSEYDGETYRYLRCSSRNSGKIPCDNKSSMPLKDMEYDLFMEYLFKSPSQLLNDSDNQEAKELQSLITQNQARLNKLTTDITQLTMLSEGLNIDELKTRLVKLNTERDTVKSENDNLNLKLSSIQDSPNTFENIKELLQYKSPARTHEQAAIENATPEGKKRNKAVFGWIENVVDSLNDNYVREGVRIMLPNLIGKIVVDTADRRFYVYNRMGKPVFKSAQYPSQRNSSEKWLESLKTYSKRKLQNGRVINLKRNVKN